MAEKFAEIARPRGEDQEICSIQEFLGENLANAVRKCPEDMKEELERPFTEEDVAEVIKKMKKVSAPGPKGITNRLMKVLQPFIGYLIAEAGNKLLREEEVPGAAEWMAGRPCEGAG